MSRVYLVTARPYRLSVPGAVGLAMLTCLLGARSVCAATAEERLARGEIEVTRLPAGHGGILGGESRGVIAAPLEQVWSVLNRAGEFANYMPNYVVSWLVDRSALAVVGGRADWKRAELENALQEYRTEDWTADTVLFYNVLDMPFPISDRWYLLEMSRDTCTHSICWNQLVGNLKSNEGSWRIESWPDPGHTLATYTTISEPGIALPPFILSLGLNSTLPGVIKGLRKRMAERGAR